MTPNGTENLGEYRRHYSERGLRQKLGAMPRNAGRLVVERAVTLYVILTDRETPMWARALIVGALGYFLNPMDLVPDVIPVLGYADDAAVMGIVLGTVNHLATPQVMERVQRLMPEGMKRKSNGKENREQ